MSVTVIHWDFAWRLQILNTRSLCHLIHHRLPTSSQRFINRTSGEVHLDWSVVFKCTFCQNGRICALIARHTSQRVSMSVPLSILYLFIIILMEFLKVRTKHKFYCIRYISVYIQPGYFYFNFRSVNVNNLNRVILLSVRSLFWVFFKTSGCDITESDCESSFSWW